MDTRVFTAHIPVDLAEKIDRIAERQDRSRGWIVRQALADWALNEEQRHLLTLEALDDVVRGDIVAHDAVLAWAESLDGDRPLPLPQPRP